MASPPNSYGNFNNRRPSAITPFPSAIEGSSYFSNVSQPQRRTSAHRFTAEQTPQHPDRVPPDVARARIERINRELIDTIRKPHDPSSSAKPLQGNGTYTHINESLPPPVPRFSHEKNMQPRDEMARVRKPKFLGLAGDGRPSKDHLKVELDPGVQRAYEVLKQALQDAEMFEQESVNKGRAYDPYVRYAALPVPESTKARLKQPPAPPKLTTDAILSGNEEVEKDVEMGGLEESRPSVGNISASDVPAVERQSYESIAMDTAIGNTSSDDVGGRRDSLPTSVTPITPTTSAVVGTTYDASRDPRRRGR